MKMELGTKIDYLGNVYEYVGIYECIGNGKMIFQSVNDDSYIILTDSIYNSPGIYACEECNNQTYNKLDKYIREELRCNMEDNSTFKINYPSAEKFLEIIKMMKKEANLIGNRSMTFYESDFYRERLEAVSNRIKLDIEKAIENDKSLKPIPNKAAKTKNSVYQTLIYDGGN